MARLRGAETGGTRHPQQSARAGSGKRDDRIAGMSPFPEGPQEFAARPKPESPQAAGLPACGRGPTSLDLRGPENDPAPGPEVTHISYHHNRILPSNRGDPFHPGGVQAGPFVGNGVPGPNEG